MSSVLQRVMSWYPNKTLYRRSSALSGRSIISVYPDEWAGPVVSHDEWFSESFRPAELPYRPDIPFFAQLAELQKISPVVSLLSSRQENAEFCHDCEGLKDCYMVFDSLNCRDVLYSARIYDSKDCVDCYWVIKSELIYEGVYLFSCFNCRFCFQCHECSDSAFLFDCRNCHRCFMCAGLRNQRYCLFNRQVSQAEYESFMQAKATLDTSQLRQLKAQFRQLMGETVWPPAFNENVEDCRGNYLKNCKDCQNVFESFDLRDCSNSFQCAMGSDVHDSFMCNDRVELCRNCVATGIQSVNTFACAFTWHSSDMSFCYLCLDCSNCFGCWGLKKKQYCILNREYTPEEYARIVPALRAELAGEDFFPDSLNPFRYEDTIASDFYGAQTAYLERELQLPAIDLPEEPLIRTCPITEKQFRLVPQETAFYDRHGIPWPLLSPRIRYLQRVQMMDTSFTPKRAAGDSSTECFFQRPERKRIVSQADYLSARY